MTAKHYYIADFNVSDSHEFLAFREYEEMTQIVTCSIRDESLHVPSLILLFREYLAERPEQGDDKLKGELYTICRKTGLSTWRLNRVALKG